MNKFITYAKSNPFSTLVLALTVVFLPYFAIEHTYLSGVVTGTSLMYIPLTLGKIMKDD